MKYMGSKARIAKHIFPIMDFFARERGLATWVEPFVGGGNMIDKVPERYARYGFDLNPHVIQALTDIRDYPELLPEIITESDYAAMRGTPPAPFTSWVRFVCSFGGKFEGGYARQKGGDAGTFPSVGKRNAVSQSGRNFAKESGGNAIRQTPGLQNVHLAVSAYGGIRVSGAVIYCDPPYQGTSGYKTGAFDHGKFFNWCREMAKNNLVFVSEYSAPEDFIPVWEGEIKTNFSSSRVAATNVARERLFLVIDNTVNSQ